MPDIDAVIAAFLDAERAGRAPSREELTAQHPELAAELAAFFRDHDTVRGLARPAGQRVRYFGDYELLEEVGRGGMGVVYKARQVSLNRTVAVKMILAGQLATAADVRRFKAEAENAANLDHPYIVPLHEVGEHEGQHYFAMKFIEGSSPTGPLPMREAAQLVAMVARAVHHAHQRGILHRDLKPANILVDRDGRPHVTDFGLARRLDATASLSPSGAIVGTPSYMPPEQAAPVKGGLTTAADVYALGAILYELLAGRPPFTGDGPAEVLLQVVRDEPAALRSARASVPHDLETVCLKCLHKKPADRYATAAAVADDLERWLRGEPVLARPIGSAGRLWRWCRRNPALAAMTIAAVFALGSGTVLSSWFAVLANRRTTEAVEKSELLREEKKNAQTQADTARRHLYAANMNLAAVAWRERNAGRTTRLLDAQPPALHGFEWHELRHRTRDDLWTLTGHTGETILSLVFHPADRLLVSTGTDGTIRLWDAATGAAIRTLRDGGPPISGVAFSPDGDRLASAEDGTVTVRDASDGRELRRWKAHAARGWGVAWHPTGERLATAGADAAKGPWVVKLWDAATGRLIHTLSEPDGTVPALAFSRDGAWLAAGDNKGAVRVWDAEGRLLRTLRTPGSVTRCLAFSPDGQRLAEASQDQTVRIWDVRAARVVRQLNRSGDWVMGVAFSPDGRRLAAVGYDRRVEVYDADSWRLLRDLRGHPWGVMCVAFSPDGRRLAAAHNAEPAIKVWDMAAGPELRTLRGHVGSVVGVAFRPDGTQLATAGSDGTVRRWHAASARQLSSRAAHRGPVRGVAFSPAGEWLASAGEDSVIRLWPADGDARILQGHDGSVNAVAFAPDGRLASAGSDKTVKVWDVLTGQVVLDLRGHTARVNAVAFSPDGKRLASAGGVSDGLPDGCEVLVWDTRTGAEVHRLLGHERMVNGLAFSRDGRLLASASSDDYVKVWDVAAGREVHHLHAHRIQAWAVAFSPIEDRLASTSLDRTVKVWDSANGQELASLEGHGSGVLAVAFSPDGRFLAADDARSRLARLRDLLREPMWSSHAAGQTWLPEAEHLIEGKAILEVGKGGTQP